MALTNLYRTLFKLELLHHYFLDEADSVYGDPNDPNDEDEIKKHTSNLRQYQLSDFFRITPTAKTMRLLKNWKARYKIQPDGIIVGIKALPDGSPTPVASVNPFIDFDSNLVMDFMIEVVDPLFENYTDIVWNKDKLVMISNRIPAVTPPPASVGDPVPVAVEFSKLSEYETTTQGVSQNVDLLKDINANELQGKFGLIRIHLEGEDINELSLVDPSDNTKMAAESPIVQLFFKNRKTNWHYFSNEDGELLFPRNNNQRQLRPLTKNGYFKLNFGGGARKYPNPDAKLIILDDGEYYSEVYI